MQYRLVDLFSGAGGYALGFIQEGFKIVLAIEKNRDPADTYMFNIRPENMFIRDIRTVHSMEILEKTGEVDVVIASPPCEAFTMASRNIMDDPLDRLYTDPRGRLTLEAIRLIGDLNPKVFVIENVPGITKKPIPDYIRMELNRVGYEKVYFNRLNALEYGTPSVRRRVFISNIRIRPERLKHIIPVSKALQGLPNPRINSEIPNHEYIPTPKRFVNRISRVRWGGGLEFYRGGGYKEYKQFIRLHPGKPAPTVMGRSRFIHPYDDRLLTVREQARLMGYPDNFIFKGGIDSQFNQVGESVPPPLSRAIAKYVRKFLESHPGN